MFLAKNSLLFFVPAVPRADAGGVQFVPRASYLPLRYLPHPARPNAQWQLRHEHPVLSVAGKARPLDGTATVLMKFDGERMNGLIENKIEHPLHLAFLDQETVRLEFVMRVQVGDDPCDDDQFIFDSVSLKLGIVTPA